MASLTAVEEVVRFGVYDSNDSGGTLIMTSQKNLTRAKYSQEAKESLRP